MNIIPAPEEIQKICDDINKELNYNGPWVTLTPYLQRERNPTDWRVRITDTDGSLICEHLVPDRLDWHTVMLFLKARTEHGKHQFELGSAFAVNKIADHHRKLLGAKMTPHQERVVQEKASLDENREKLHGFIHQNEFFKTLPATEQDRMKRQYKAMSDYSVILGERIEYFKGVRH